MYTKLTGNPLTPDIAFTTLAVFGQLSHPFIMIPHIVNCHINGFISTGRLRTFFEAPEYERSNDSNHNRLVDAEVRLNGSVNYEVNMVTNQVSFLLVRTFCKVLKNYFYPVHFVSKESSCHKSHFVFYPFFNFQTF